MWVFYENGNEPSVSIKVWCVSSDHLLKEEILIHGVGYYYKAIIIRGRDSSVSIAIGYDLGGGEQDFVSRQGQDIFFFPTAPRPSLVQNAGSSSWRAKAAGSEADHSSLYSSKIKNGGAILPLRHTSSWHGA
jgi:hypothetical protein